MVTAAAAHYVSAVCHVITSDSLRSIWKQGLIPGGTTGRWGKALTRPHSYFSTYLLEDPRAGVGRRGGRAHDCAIVFDVGGMIRDGNEILLTANGNALVGRMVNLYLYVNHVVRFDTSSGGQAMPLSLPTERRGHLWLYWRE